MGSLGVLLLWTLLRCFYRVVWKSPAAVFGASTPYCLPACSASASGRMVAAVHLLVTGGEGEGFRDNLRGRYGRGGGMLKTKKKRPPRGGLARATPACELDYGSAADDEPIDEEQDHR